MRRAMMEEEQKLGTEAMLGSIRGRCVPSDYKVAVGPGFLRPSWGSLISRRHCRKQLQLQVS